MDRKENLTDRPRHALRSSPLVDGVLSNLVEFGGNMTSLAELQAKLAASELREYAGRAAAPIGIIVAAGVLVTGAVPVVLLGCVELLCTRYAIARDTALLATSGIALTIGLVAIAFAATKLIRALDAFRHSREEFTRNVAWVKSVLAQSGRSMTR